MDFVGDERRPHVRDTHDQRAGLRAAGFAQRGLWTLALGASDREVVDPESFTVKERVKRHRLQHP